MRKDEVKEKLKEAINVVNEVGWVAQDAPEIVVAAFAALCDEYPDYLLTDREKTQAMADWIQEPDGTPLDGLVDSAGDAAGEETA